MQHAFYTLPQPKDEEEAHYILNLLYDEYFGFVRYSDQVFKENPLISMRMWKEENVFEVLTEKQDMRRYVEGKIGELVPGMSYEAYKRLKTYEKDWLIEILANPTPPPPDKKV